MFRRSHDAGVFSFSGGYEKEESFPCSEDLAGAGIECGDVQTRNHGPSTGEKKEKKEG